MPKALAGLLAALLLLGACGFQPLYGKGGGTRERLAQVAIEPASDRVGQLVRNRLLDDIEPPSASRPTLYRLKVNVVENKEGLAIKEDRTITRYNLRLRAKYRLLRIADGNQVMEGETSSLAAYNVVTSDYANLIAERDARERAAQDIADAIALRVAVALRPRS